MSYIYYTKPDGSIGTMSVTYNRDGSIRPAGSVSSCEIIFSSPTTKRTGILPAKKKKLLTSNTEVDNLLNSWKNCGGNITEKSLKKATSKIKDPILRIYFEDKLTDLCQNGELRIVSKLEQTKKAETNASTIKSYNLPTHNSIGDKIISSKEVDELVIRLTSNEVFPSESIIKKHKERMASFGLRDYFDRKLEEAKSKTKEEKHFVVYPNTALVTPRIATPRIKTKSIKTNAEIDLLVYYWSQNNTLLTDKLLNDTRKSIVSTSVKSYFEQLLKQYSDLNKLKFHSSNLTTNNSTEHHKDSISTSSKKRLLETRTDIDKLIQAWLSTNSIITDKTIRKAKNRISDPTLIDYFNKKIEETRTTKYSSSVKEEAKKVITRNKAAKNTTVKYTTSPSYSAPQGSQIGGRKPKYGYARDIFGRIQERDHYVEDRPINKYNSSSSIYDSEDDHDSTYECGYDYD